MKKNLIWFAVLLSLAAFSLPPLALADDPPPICDTDPSSCQPPSGIPIPVPLPPVR